MEPSPALATKGSSLRLRHSCVDVWKVRLTCSEECRAQAVDILSRDERERAAHMGLADMRQAFEMARAALRSLLAVYLHRPPGTISLIREGYGRPRLQGDDGICFSATRSGDLAAFAFSTQTEIGIDMERRRTIANMDRVIERMFSPAEKRQLELLPPAMRQLAFFACWTRKEAYAKATGKGILTPFHEFCVDANPDEAKPAIRFEFAPADEHWTLHDLRLNDECSAALAYRGVERAISIFDGGSVTQVLAMGIGEWDRLAGQHN